MDHLNMEDLQADARDPSFAPIKTSLDPAP
jgi:hypothetical protein